MKATLTHSALLARCVPVHVVFFRFGDEETGADPIVAVFREESRIEGFAKEHGHVIRYPEVYWQEIPLQGPAMPYLEWPDVETVHLVTECGMGNDKDTELDPVALAAFVDLEGAQAYAAARNNENVVVRTVALDVALPIPEWITGDPLKY